MKKIFFCVLLLAAFLFAATACNPVPSDAEQSDTTQPEYATESVGSTHEDTSNSETESASSTISENTSVAVSEAEHTNVKRIDFSSPEIEPYQKMNKSRWDYSNAASLYYLGENYILGEGNSLFFLDSATNKKRLLLEGLPDEGERSIGYGFRIALDDYRFIYDCTGWEWSNGDGIYDVRKNEKHPFENGDVKFNFLERFENRLYCVPINQNNAHGRIDNLDLLVVNADDYSSKLYPIELHELNKDVMNPEYYNGYSFSPDYKRLAVYTADQLYLHNVSDGKIFDTYKFKPGEIIEAAYMGSNNVVYAACRNETYDSYVYEITLD